MLDFFFDFETRSRLDIKKVGGVKYALHDSTEATLLTWAIGEGPVKAWRLGQPIPQEIINAANNPQLYRFIAHNIEFDYMIWTQKFMKKKIPIENLQCTMALGQRFGAGRGLEDVARTLGFFQGKDKQGRMIMLKQCKPAASGKYKGEFPELTAKEWDDFEKYGKQDTVLLRQVYRVLPKLGPTERWAWEWTFKRNLKGIRMDMPLLKGMTAVLKKDLKRLNKEFNEIVGDQFTVTQRERCLQWFRKYMPGIPNMRSETIRDILLNPPAHVPKPVLRALEIKSIAGSASVKKISAALDREVNGRVFQNLVYNGAHTKRWAGSGLQVHNFPRAEDIVGGDEAAINVVCTAPEIADMMYDNSTIVLKNLLRRIFLPDEGLSFYCGDYSKIEPTVLFWLVGLGTPPKNWYEDMAATIYGVRPEDILNPSEERQLGKAAALGCGYGMGWMKFKKDCKDKQGIIVSDELAQKAVGAYRRKYNVVVKFWYALESAFSMAIAGRTTPLCGGKIQIGPMTSRHRGVYIQIPSGSRLFYHAASHSPEGLIFQQAKQGQSKSKGLYGGLLTEHVVSSTSRDIMLNGMINLERSNFAVLNTVHDEDWAQSQAGRMQEFKAAMLTLPEWAKSLHLTVDASEGERYWK